MRLLFCTNERDNKILRKKTKVVTNFQDPEIIIMKQAMMQEVLKPNAAGIAANQLGYKWRAFLMHPQKDQPPIWVFNPRIIAKSKKIRDLPEGCLSVPGKKGVVTRHLYLDAFWQNELGYRMSVVNEKQKVVPIRLEDFAAHIFQHEFDHVMGELYIDIAKNIEDV